MSESGQVLTNIKSVQLGGKKRVQIMKSTQELKKIAWNSGKSYKLTSKRLVAGKRF